MQLDVSFGEEHTTEIIVADTLEPDAPIVVEAKEEALALNVIGKTEPDTPIITDLRLLYRTLKL